MSPQKPLTTFITEQGLSAVPERTASHPHAVDWGTDVPQQHWTVRLTANGLPRVRRMTVPFSQGSAHTEAPTLAEVLDCLASDAASVENAKDFEDWCAEYGYDTDSRTAERTYKAVVKQTAALKRWLGDEAFAELLWEVERQ